MKKKGKWLMMTAGSIAVIGGLSGTLVACSTNGSKTVVKTTSNNDNSPTSQKTASNDGKSASNNSHQTTTDNGKSSADTGKTTVDSGKSTVNNSQSSNSNGQSSSNSSKTATSSSQSSTDGNKPIIVKPTVKLYQIPSNLTNGYDKSINNGNYVESNGFNAIKTTVVKVLDEMKNELTTMLNDSNSLISHQTGFMPSNNPFIIDNQQKIIGYTDGNQIAVYQYDATMTTAIQSVDYMLSAFNTTIQFSSSVGPKYYENVTSAILQTFGTWLQCNSTYSFSNAVGFLKDGSILNNQSTMDQLSENIKAFIQQNPASEYKRLNTSNNAFLQNVMFLNNYDNQIFNNSDGFFYGDTLPPTYNTTSNDLIVQWLSFIQIVNQNS